MKRAELARTIDHTLLKPDATRAAVERLCNEARRFSVASVCVNGARVEDAADLLTGAGVPVAAVVGFPLGASATEMKAAEAAQVVEAGAAEIDMVMNVGWAKDGDWERVRTDVAAVVAAALGVPVKVILETCLLTDDEKRRACEAAVAGGAAFVKTSTGFAGGGATVEDVRLMRAAVGDRARVKASGGMRDTSAALAMLEAGADRLGMSATVAVLEGCPE